MEDGIIYALEDPDRNTLLDAAPTYNNLNNNEVYFWKKSNRNDP